MQKIIVIIIVLIACWFGYQQFKGTEKKPDNMVTKYAEGLKSSEEKAEEAKDTANLAIIRSAIISFKGSQGRYPADLEELRSKGYIDRIPEGILYDKETGEIKY